MTPLSISGANQTAQPFIARVESVAGHLESLEANEILLCSSQVEKIDTVVRRTFGLDSPTAGTAAVNLHVLSGGRAIVQVNQKNE